MKSIFSGSAIIATALFAGSLTFSAKPSAAETHFFQSQQEIKNPKLDGGFANNHSGVTGESSNGLTHEVIERPSPGEGFAAPPTAFVATAYSLRGKTASGRLVSKGIIAADPRVLPLGSRVRLEAGFFSGDYLVADTGGAVRGKRIDIWTPSTRQAFRFGRRTVKLTVLSYGPRRSPSRKAKR